MLTKSTESALILLTCLAMRDSDEPIAPTQIAQEIGLSPTYMAKIANQLVKANILIAYRGSRGGVVINRPLNQITFLDVMEACQGVLKGDFCQKIPPGQLCCIFHKAMDEVFEAVNRILKRWTVADLVNQFQTHGAEVVELESCKLHGLNQWIKEHHPVWEESGSRSH